MTRSLMIFYLIIINIIFNKIYINIILILLSSKSTSLSIKLLKILVNLVLVIKSGKIKKSVEKL